MSNFISRHIGLDKDAYAHMCKTIGVASAEEIMQRAIPSSIANWPQQELAPLGEHEVLIKLKQLAGQNTVHRSLIGQGFYGTITPSVITRNILENPSWYTAYTPYQPEISQGRLEAILNFQTMICDLTGMEIANASMLDEGSAAAEAMLMARRANRTKSNRFAVHKQVFPATLAVIQGRAKAIGIEIVLVDTHVELPSDIFGLLLQNPDTNGQLHDFTEIIEAAHEQGALVAVTTDLLALCLYKTPGEMGADMALGSSQRFGIPLGFGGPSAAFIATKDKYARALPGRLVGVSKDAAGAKAYRLALQAREQHIRREKATSNICTAQVILAVMASMYAVYHGPHGIKEIATQVHEKAVALAKSVSDHIVHTDFFDTILVQVNDAKALVKQADEAGFDLALVDESHVRISVDETVTWEEIATLQEILPHSDHTETDFTNAAFQRTSAYLEHPVFNSYHSETQMMRYLKRIADRDYALDKGMIPLGSCTMKINAATEMQAITWPEFSSLHPFAPLENAAGSLALIKDIEHQLARLTGYDTVSLQPNAGSQGELAGLLAIRGYHQGRGEEQRDICLIPQSAHGTNAASAALAGLRVQVVGTDENGNINLVDLAEKIAKAEDKLAALMITYPSTHGVFEETVEQVCDMVHEAGGQVYIDGANFNALVGFAKPGNFGGDVSHLNLHKTFAIPHGGGGPGVGPVAAKAHLAPYLPSHPFIADFAHSTAGSETITHAGEPLTSAPFGSASILPITWAYLQLMGDEGIRKATAAAVLNANYIAKRLEPYYPVLYTGKDGFVAHECILDLRPITDATGVTVDDVAKRLIDYGFHAPTMSFPVAGTIMVEPTESEDLEELDRFIAAMIDIRQQADKVAAGYWPADDNPLCNAPHTAYMLTQEWNHPYSRQEAVYPFLTEQTDGASDTRIINKYWPAVRRVDNAWGDRNLMCSCPAIEAFRD